MFGNISSRFSPVRKSSKTNAVCCSKPARTVSRARYRIRFWRDSLVLCSSNDGAAWRKRGKETVDGFPSAERSCNRTLGRLIFGPRVPPFLPSALSSGVLYSSPPSPLSSFLEALRNFSRPRRNSVPVRSLTQIRH